MQEIRNFLSKVLTAQSITKEIREEALQLRDSIDLRKNVGVITDVGGFGVVYPGEMKGNKNNRISLRDVKRCEADARKDRVNGNLGKIPMIKQLRSLYNIGLKDAKNLAEWLESENIITFEPR